MTTRRSALLTASLLAFPLFTLPHALAASLTTSVAVGASNDPQTYVSFYPDGFAYSGTGAPVSANGSETFSGLDSNNNPASMTFSGSATASAAYGILRTAASGSVSGVYYNGNNSPYYSYDDFGDDDEETGDWVHNPDGTPSFLLAYGQAQFSDTLNYGTIPAGFTTDFYFHVTGSFTGTNVYHSIYAEFGEASDHIILYPVDGANQIWATKKFTPLSGVDMSFRTTVLSSFNFYPEYANEGETYSGSADFMNTVTLAGVNLYDEAGNPVSGWSLTSGSGTAYPIPEPSAALLGLAGALGFLARRRRS